MLQTCRLDSPGQTLVFASLDGRMPSCIYWGQALPEHEDLKTLALALLPPIGSGTLDLLPEPSLCPEAGRAYPGEPGIILADAHGLVMPTQFEFKNVTSGLHELAIESCDTERGLCLTTHLALDQANGVLTAENTLVNRHENSIQLQWLTTPTLPPPTDVSHFLDYAGRWTQELGEHLVPFARGVHSRSSRRGRPGHDHFPALVVAPQNNRLGDAYGWHLGWSGNHRMIVEELPNGRRLVQFGEALEPGEVCLGQGDAYTTPRLYAAFTADGMNGLSHAFQTHVRGSVLSWPDISRPRLVHYNCWEAVYFDHKLDRLKSLADKAAMIGAERFVLDDGWFRGRDDDTTSLGDWFVDTEKYPQGLQPLIDHVERNGMTFGLWVEPEMVNPVSDLANRHPDWIIAPKGYEPVLGRQQQVLDLTNPAVTDYLFERLDALLTEYRIDYLKWDMNRDLANALDGEGRPLGHRQTLALYNLLQRLRDWHPNVEIESCASGGGRMDYGILRYAQRVWLSDSNDAHERWRMQQAAQTFLPPEIIGSHVGPRISHTSGRQLSMAFRAAVAMTGHMGFEMDLDELTAEECETLAAATRFYITNRDFLHTGRQYRLTTPERSAMAQMTVSHEQDRFLIFYGSTAVEQNEAPRPLKLQGLSPGSHYQMSLLNPDILAKGTMRRWASPLADADGFSLTGGALMLSGLGLPLLFPNSMLIIEGHVER